MRGIVMRGNRELLVLALLAAAATTAPAQETTPVWAKPDLFWFRRTMPAGNVWIKVDVTHGVKEPLFDHQRLAIELSLRSGAEYTPNTLPFADPAAQFVVKYDGSNAYIQQGAMAIEFVLDGTFWRCDLQIKWNWNLVPPTDYECLPRRPATPGQSLSTDAPPRASPDGRWEALIVNHNVAIRPRGDGAATTVLSTDGVADYAYHAGSIRWSEDSRTVIAYRVNAQVWQAEGLFGNVKGHISRGEWSVPASQ
jgi:hypothetical protein